MRPSAVYWRPIVLVLTIVVVACGDAPTAPVDTPPPDPGLARICYPTGSLDTDHEIYASDISDGWARVRCAAEPPAANRTEDGFCRDWQQCTTAGANGLRYVAFVVQDEEMGGHIEFRLNEPHSAVLAIHPGGGGTSWPGSSSGTEMEYRALEQENGIRVVRIRWLDPGISYYIRAGRFVRSSADATTLRKLSRRPAAVLEWIYDNLNTAGRPFGILGTSGGADAALAPFYIRSEISENIEFLGLVSYAPFYDFVSACNEITPPGTFVDPATGRLGDEGAGATLTLDGNPGVKRLPDSIWKTAACQSASVTTPIAAASNTRDLLDAAAADGIRFRGSMYVSVATLNDSDNVTGTTWAAGNIHNHPVFATANSRVWFECRGKTHGHQTDPGNPCLDDLLDAVVGGLIGSASE